MTKLNSIPVRIKIKTLFSNRLVYAGLFVLSISGILLSGFIPNLDIYNAKFQNGTVDRINGVLTSISETNTTVNEDRIYRYSYEFVFDGEIIFGHSYGKRTELNASDTVHIEYLKEKINISRIIGTKNGPFSIEFLYMLLGFFCTGLILTFYPLYQKLLLIKTLESGFEIVSSSLDSEFKFPFISNRKSSPYYRLKFKYSFGNRKYEKVVSILLNDLQYRRIRFSNILLDLEKPNKGYILELFTEDLKNLIYNESSIANIESNYKRIL